MIRRCCALAVALGGLISLSACSTVDKPAATVNGFEISADEVVSDIKLVEQLQGAAARSAFSENGVITDANVARSWLSTRIRWQIALDALGDTALEPAALDQIRSELASGSETWATLDPAFQEMAIRGIAAEAAVGEAELQAAEATADVDISSTIGRWDPEIGQIVPAGS